jgi:glycosyltransferase involved in cell wall biosynthesis
VRRDTRLGRAGLVARLLAIVGRIRPDVVNAHRAYATVAARLVRPFGRFALVATDHNEFEAKGRFLSAADLIVAVSHGAATSLASTGVPRSRIRVVPNGPLRGARQLRAGSATRVSLPHPAVVTVAGLLERKGVHVLLDAFAAVAADHPAAHLYYVGDGPERVALERRSAELGLAERVHLVGFQADPGSYLRAADIFVLASFRESFGLAALEARAAGCAVVVSNADGLPEAVNRGVAGMVVPARDVDALAGALRILLGSPGELAQRQRCASVHLEQFTAARMASNTEHVYQQAMANA